VERLVCTLARRQSGGAEKKFTIIDRHCPEEMTVVDKQGNGYHQSPPLVISARVVVMVNTYRDMMTFCGLYSSSIPPEYRLLEPSKVWFVYDRFFSGASVEGSTVRACNFLRQA
jgi:hypothetical protein